MADVRPGMIVRLNAGTYHVVSEYGDINAVVRADIQVEAGKLIEATLQHRAAQITLKLVSQPGGEAIADTAWSVLTAAGDIVNESVSAFSKIGRASCRERGCQCVSILVAAGSLKKKIQEKEAKG